MFQRPTGFRSDAKSPVRSYLVICVVALIRACYGIRLADELGVVEREVGLRGHPGFANVRD